MPSTSVLDSSLPVFDFSGFRAGTSEERMKTANRVTYAFKTYGFVYLVNHGLPKERIQALFDWSKKLFLLPQEVLMSPELRRPEPESIPGNLQICARGYGPVGMEKLSNLDPNDENGLKAHRGIPDAKELFETGPYWGIGQEREPNRYPSKDVLPGFEEFVKEFFMEAQELTLDILRSIAIGLGLEENYFVHYHEDADNLFRFLRYPPIERATLSSGETARTSPHTDFGTITILFQDDVGGLQVENPENPGTYLVATPVEGSVIVNVGDFLMRWTNDSLKSNLHRVVEPPAERELGDGLELTKERFSMPYFVQADRSKVVECIESLKGDGAKYPPISAGEYINLRTNAVFKSY
ncbi:Clavaminate synthase-like protein [Eremomyces bilateralis CBS 781.70]|uniref:Clavaminate synthase-like protein n=1 Tax=Eremomyces bilateralis CBS 781.70 TaxID=1392243 RepID=A0A6G1FWQ3_9PEZI|nr:Clavaminate synthase-like protein [Eremomyces bilateralis CBS 781.70]KAF1810059.1 Clavaminate synthase-like protein [Eremomyces bilateralis CBS 781.70]